MAEDQKEPEDKNKRIGPRDRARGQKNHTKPANGLNFVIIFG